MRNKRHTRPTFHRVSTLAQAEAAILDLLWRNPRSIGGLRHSIEGVENDDVNKAVEELIANGEIELGDDGKYTPTRGRRGWFFRGELLTPIQLVRHPDNVHGLGKNALVYRLVNNWPANEVLGHKRTDGTRWVR